MASEFFIFLSFLLTIPSILSIKTSGLVIRALAEIPSSPSHTSPIYPPPNRISESKPSIPEVPSSPLFLSIKESPAPTSPTTSLDPKQVMALQSLGMSTAVDPCSPAVPENATVCDAGKPFRHLISLQLRNCSSDIIMSSTAMTSLDTLQSLAFFDCPLDPIRFPDGLASNLRSFTCVNSLRRLTGVWLSRLEGLTDLTVDGVPINASGPSIILSKMTTLKSVRIVSANLSGFLPKTWQSGIAGIDFSGNDLKGSIPSSITQLSELKHLDLSSNKLSGSIPSTIGDLSMLRNLSFAHNSLDGPLPDSLAGLSSLVHLDLSGNQFNGSVPGFLSEMKSLTYLNLENNNFQGIVPFNASFIKQLVVFKVGGNANLCYNSSVVSSKLKLGISPCDKNGLPISTPGSNSDSPALPPTGDVTSESANGSQGSQHHGPSTTVLVMAIGLSTIVFLIIFCIFLSRWCS